MPGQTVRNSQMVYKMPIIVFCYLLDTNVCIYIFTSAINVRQRAVIVKLDKKLQNVASD